MTPSKKPVSLKKDLQFERIEVLNDKLKSTDYSKYSTGVLLTTKAVCRMFDVTPNAVYKWRKHKGFPSISLAGGKCPPVRFDEGQVKAWAKAINKKIENNDFKEEKYS